MTSYKQTVYYIQNGRKNILTSLESHKDFEMVLGEKEIKE